jgi:hypothetical protein
MGGDGTYGGGLDGVESSLGELDARSVGERFRREATHEGPLCRCGHDWAGPPGELL